MVHRWVDHSSSEAHCFSVRIGLFLDDSGNFIQNKGCGKNALSKQNKIYQAAL